MRGAPRARLRFAAAVAVVLAAAAACGVDVDVQGEPSGTPPAGSEGGPGGEGGNPMDGGLASDGDAGTVVTSFGDASLRHPTSIDLLAGDAAVKVTLLLEKDPRDPSKLTAATITTSTSDVVVADGSFDDTHRDFLVRAIATATPHRPPASISATVGGIPKTIPIAVRIARHFRNPEEVVLNVPATTPSTTYEFLLWGGGGLSAFGNGGAGGFAQGQAVLFGAVTVRVGGPGGSGAGGTHGGGAGLGGGGGYSAIFTSDAVGASTATALIIAGGGGGAGANAGISGAGGGGRAIAGQPGGGGNGGGSPTNAGGGLGGGGTATDGGALAGGDGDQPTGGGGGGGGWYGGGGGHQGCGGAGGLSRASAAANATFMNATGSVPGNSGDARRVNAGSPGFPGAVLITPL